MHLLAYLQQVEIENWAIMTRETQTGAVDLILWGSINLRDVKMKKIWKKRKLPHLGHEMLALRLELTKKEWQVDLEQRLRMKMTKTMKMDFGSSEPEVRVGKVEMATKEQKT